MGEEREVAAKLRITKEGDVGAFKEATADVEKFGQTAAEVTPAIDALEQKIEALGREADAVAKSVEQGTAKTKGADEASAAYGATLATLVEKLSSLAGKALSVWAAFEAGQAAGEKIRRAFNWLTDGAFDSGLQKFITDLSELNSIGEDTAAQADRIRNAYNILAKSGLDPAGMSVEQLFAALDKLNAKHQAEAEAVLASDAAYEAWVKKSGLARAELDKQAEGLTQLVAHFKAANKDLSDTQVGEIFGKQLQKILDGYRALGQEAPASMRQLADAWNVTTSVVEAASDRQARAVVKSTQEQAQAVAALVSSIAGKTTELAGTLEQKTAIITAAFAKIDFGNLSEAGMAKAKAAVQGLVDEYIAAGQKVPASLDPALTATNVLVGAIDRAGAGVTTFIGKAGGLKGDAIKAELDKIKDGAAGAGTATATAGAQIAEAGQTVGKSTTPLEEVQAAYKAVKDNSGEAATGTDASALKIADAGKKAGAGAVPLAAVGKAGEEAGKGMQTAATGADNLATGADKAATAGDKVKVKLLEIPSTVEPVTIAIAAIEKALAGLGASKDFSSKIISQLNAIETAARAAATALDAVACDEGGSAPIGPVASH